MEKLIGRETETELLQKFFNSQKPEFVAVYGRRRVGKTFLIRKFFNDKFDFYVTGIIEGTREEELSTFNNALKKHGYQGDLAKNWLDAFDHLAEILKAKAVKKKRCVVFIDELPCFDTQNSGFVHAFDHFWNGNASWINNIFLIICGSATSWMISNVINNRGGLHNRITHEIHLSPFDLATCEKYCKSHKFKWDRLSIIQIFTALGGVPYYWSLLDFDNSAADNIDYLFFSENAELRREYRRLFGSLFRNPDNYISVISLLADNKQGLTRRQIAEKLGVSDNGYLGNILEDLVNCDFLRQYSNDGKINSGIFQLIDFYTLFYHQFCKRRTSDTHYWRNHIGTTKQNTWYGLAYEKICLVHINHIIRILRLDAIHTEFYSWRSKTSDPAAQIDIVIDRADGVITICEVKYSKTKFTITKSENTKLQNRIEAFSNEHNLSNSPQIVLITTLGLKSNSHATIIDKTITMNNLFGD